MLFLILLVIAIALGFYVSNSGLYNGGDAYSKSASKVSATQLLNAAQQISGANVVYSVQNGGTYATAISDLTSGGVYLKSEPRVPENFTISSDITGNVIEINSSSASAEVCAEVNSQAGYASGSEPTDEATVTRGFGCFDDSGTATFIMK